MNVVGLNNWKLLKRLLLFLLILSNACVGLAQPVNVLSKTDNGQHALKFEVLPNRSYTFNQVLNDKSLKFLNTDTLSSSTSYWLKLIVFNPLDERVVFNLTAFPNYDNTLYHYNALRKKWIAHRSGYTSNKPPQLQGIHPYALDGLKQDTIYININVNSPHVARTWFQALVLLTPRDVAERSTQHIFTAWLVGTVILLLFFLNNLYIYISFNDKTIIYYLIIQLSGMVYLTTYGYFFDLILPCKPFSFMLVNRVFFYNWNILLQHVAIVGIFYGFIQLTRSYLNTKIVLPLYDKLLKYGLNIYMSLSLTIALINCSGFLIEHQILIYDNAYCLLLLSGVLCTCVVGYQRKLPNTGSFLAANILPLFFTACVAIYNIFISTGGDNNYWMPVLAAASQALGFSVALVTRTRAIRDSLLASELESRQLAFDLKEVAYQNELKEKELQKANADIKTQAYQNELLHERVAAHQRELASSTLFMVQKNELLTHLKSQISELKRSDRYHAGKNLDGMIALLENNTQLDTEWDKFKMHFEQVHPDFFSNIKKQHPSLTQKETRLYAYFEMKLSHKEIAVLLDIDQASVRRAKTRLLKKMSSAPGTD
jgi:hypothetical protein